MKKIIAILLCFLLSFGVFAGCASTPEDQSASLLDADGKLTVYDSDDKDLSAIDEEFEIKTSSAGSTASTDSSGSTASTATTTDISSDHTASAASGTTHVVSNSTSSAAGTANPGESTPSADSDNDLPQVTVNLTKQTVSDNAYAEFDGNTLKILQSADFSLTGNFYGCIEASLGYNEVVRLRMAGVNLLNTTGPVVKVLNLVSDEKNDSIANNPDNENQVADDQQTEYDQPDLIISFTDGTANTLEVKDCNLSDMTGAIYSECSLSIRGHGQGTIKNANQNAIHCLKSVEVRNVDLELIAPAGRGVYTKARYENNEGCTVKISAYRDAIKCDKFYMNDGTLLAYSQDNDAIDSEDRAIISGGTLIADTADTSKNYGIKVRRILEDLARPDKHDTFEITGGTLIAAGGLNTLPDAATTTAKYLHPDESFAIGADQYALKDSSGKLLLAFSTAAARPDILISAPSLTDGNCHIWRGGSIGGATEYLLQNNIIVFGTGLYTGGSYTGGKDVGNITVQ